MTGSTRPINATRSKIKIQPLADRVVVRPLEETREETEEMRGGRYIPDTAKEKPRQREIIPVAPLPCPAAYAN